MPPRKKKAQAKNEFLKSVELSIIEEDTPILALEDANLTLLSKKLHDIDMQVQSQCQQLISNSKAAADALRSDFEKHLGRMSKKIRDMPISDLLNLTEMESSSTDLNIVLQKLTSLLMPPPSSMIVSAKSLPLKEGCIVGVLSQGAVEQEETVSDGVPGAVGRDNSNPCSTAAAPDGTAGPSHGTTAAEEEDKAVDGRLARSSPLPLQAVAKAKPSNRRRGGAAGDPVGRAAVDDLVTLKQGKLGKQNPASGSGAHCSAASTPAVGSRMTRQQRSAALLLSTPMMPKIAAAAASSLGDMEEETGRQQQQGDDFVAPGSSRLTGFALTSKTLSRSLGGPGGTARGTAGSKRTRRRGEADAAFSEDAIAISTYDGQQFLVDGELGLEGVPLQYRAEVAQQLEVMQRLVAAALQRR
ncbi:hypothetical protein CEUSTIGMA_g1838.t1 [Chlamydomonas eustigma]|uniref:Borealin N-terminal domain-containing protein n=1 Tax=Chlamydomonas eustigma TaxID=1157962 RepID=A0A250WV23_9CHLO|nr:hypothetical protein CEUSTIGMA_g1838.t1 [Chlamydomonas eustigma]|eukprot:GAX74390.1 hypothetical protein CEUSTIGMA_g1838.t1 [Chlamydomonas eustigma]